MMPMRRFLLTLAFALCSVAVHAEQDLYNPLAVGLKWDVDVELNTPGGKAVNGTAVREITGTEKIGHFNYFAVVTSFTGLPQVKDFTVYRRKSSRGIYSIYSGDPSKQEILEAALPLEVGQTWKTVVGMQMITSTVESKETVTAGGKTYENCIKVTYKSSDGQIKGTYYQAPDVGNVLETSSRSGATYKFTLKAYSGLK